MNEEMRAIIIGTLFVLAFAFVSDLLVSKESENFDTAEAAYGSWACSADVYVCPDGTEVYRTPPYCKFAACPSSEF